MKDIIITISIFFAWACVFVATLYYYVGKGKKHFYVIIINEVYDYETSDHKPELYRSKEDALKRLEEIYNEARIAYGKRWIDDTGDITDGIVSLYLDGEESCNHYYATLHKVEAL